ncbi:hypothetical protein SAMN05877962_12624 [Alloalcanivorax xenomutans]|nr:hypothetical protein SAMN05877962_12624 [Alloalcanivorax xenomutans]
MNSNVIAPSSRDLMTQPQALQQRIYLKINLLQAR